MVKLPVVPVISFLRQTDTAAESAVRYAAAVPVDLALKEVSP
jgi:hypothetical protein